MIDAALALELTTFQNNQSPNPRLSFDTSIFHFKTIQFLYFGSRLVERTGSLHTLIGLASRMAMAIIPWIFHLPAGTASLSPWFRPIAIGTALPKAAELDLRPHFPKPAYKALAEAGILGYWLPTEYGGGGGNFSDALAICETLARHTGSLANLFIVSSVCGALVAKSGSPQQREQLCQPLSAATRRWLSR